ncbi:MAG TPA: hypothetical protein VHG28_04115 [Longimicrobiaceae bacterium]|nr:hypothetical protein [Longimicrobiaceae bacterium]
MRGWPLVCAALLAACSVATSPAAELDQEFRLRYLEQAVLDGGRLTVSFREVPSDSRCPVDAQCIQAGEATVVLSLAKPGREASVVALRTTPGKDIASYGEYRVELRRLDPAPRVRGIPPGSYVATLRIHRE